MSLPVMIDRYKFSFAPRLIPIPYGSSCIIPLSTGVGGRNPGTSDLPLIITGSQVAVEKFDNDQ